MYKKYMTIPGRVSFDDILNKINERQEKIVAVIAFDNGSIFVVEVK